MAHQGSFPLDGDTAGDLVAAVIDVLQGCGNHVHVVVGVNAAGDAQTQQVEAAEAVLAGHRVTVGQDVADLATADACLEVELAGQGLSGELFLGNVAQHLVGVDEQGMAAHGTLIRNAILVELLGQILNLVDAGLKHVKLGVLVQTDCQSVQVTAVHTTVGDEALEGDAEQLGALVPLLAVGSDETAHVHNTVLLGRHGHGVNVGVHLAGNLLDGLVGVALLTGLDKVRVLGKAGAVHHYGHAILVAQLAGVLDVLHRHGLAANGVVGHGQYHEGNITLVLLEHLLQLLERNVALEGELELGVLGLVDGDVDGLGLAGLDVTLGGVEVGVTGNDVAFLHQIREQHVLGSTALVGGDDILEAEDALYHALELVE